jgi:malonyl-CoA O-methyltransferase
MKEKIKENFSRAAKEYDRYATFQLEAGKRLLKRLKLLQNPFPLLDLGSGTGKLFEGWRGVFALDISTAMATECKRRGLLSVTGDGELLPFKEESFKVVFSNFSLQWMELSACSCEVFRVLKDGGYFLASIPVEGSLEKLLSAWNTAHRSVFGEDDKLFTFPKEEDVFKVFSNFELIEFERCYLEKEFPSPKEALKILNRLGARNPFRKVKISKKVVELFYRFFEENGSFPVNYRVLFLTLKKP